MAGTESRKEAMEKIEEFLNEENKIVVYKWLSRTLSIDVDTAKHYLSCFVEENKSKYPINICYLLSGIQEKEDNAKVHKIIVTSQDKLEESKSLLSTITGFHVYSIQLSKIQDASVLYTTEVVSNNKLEDQQKYSAVKYDNVKIIPKRKLFESKISDHTQSIKTDRKESVKLQPPPTKKKKNGLFSLWQKQQSNSSKTEKKEKVSPVKPSVVDTADKKGTLKFPILHENNTDSKELPKTKEDLKTKKPTIKENEARKIEKKVPSKLKRKRKQGQEHKLSSEEDKGKLTSKKRHKRIMQISESESEPEDELPEEELDFQSKKLRICEESSEESNIEEDDKSPLPASDNSTLSYKTVNKTYVDENGFMVTKKVKECIRESPKKEENLPVQETKSTTSTVSSESVNPVKKKQVSLMNFFTKK